MFALGSTNYLCDDWAPDHYHGRRDASTGAVTAGSGDVQEERSTASMSKKLTLLY